MKNLLTLFTAFLLTTSSLSAQVVKAPPGLPNVHEPVHAPMLPQAPVTNPGPVLPPLILGPGCTSAETLGTAANMLTISLNGASSIAVDNATNSMVFIHRNNPTAFGGHSGQLRYDLSTNGGQTWTTNLGLLNPASVNGTNGARHPSVAIYNPVGNTNPNNAYLAYVGATVGTTFNGMVSGVRRLNGTGTTETYNQAGVNANATVRSLVKGAQGVLWSVEQISNGTTTTGYRILKGTWNGTTDYVWSLNTTLMPNWNLLYDGNPYNSDFSLGFDPTGTIGWFCVLGHISPGPAAFRYYPIVYKTTNGGISWSGPTQLDMALFQCSFPSTTTNFDMDMTVDVNGNPHIITTRGISSGDYSFQYGAGHGIVDIHLDRGVWIMESIASVSRGRGTWGVAPNAISMDMNAQVSRSDDGTKIFIFWADAAGTAGDPNQEPDLFGMGYNVTTRSYTSPYNFTNCNPNFAGQAYFPHAAPTALNLANGHKIPFAVADFSTVAQDPLITTNLYYLDSVAFLNSQYIFPKCNANISLATTDTVYACPSVVLDPQVGEEFLWNTGATTQSITVTTSGWYGLVLRSSCCFGSDSVYVQVMAAPQATFNASGTFLSRSFTDLSTGSPTSWSWDFGDGNLSTQQNPTHVYASAGTYSVCLTVTNACSTSTTCQNVTVTCVLPSPQFSFTAAGLVANFTNLTAGTGISYLWNFGDGGLSTSASPSHAYINQGVYTVCLIATDACGSDTSCQQVAVGCTLPVSGFSTGLAGLTVTFTDLSTGSPTSYLWNFGDGGLSTNASPQHVYTASGVYTVCLTTTNTCGTDTLCQTINVCLAPTAAYSVTAGTGPTFGFQDLSTGSPTSWFWDFGDGNFSTAQNPFNVYAAAGTYTVCLTAINSCDSSTFCGTVQSVIGSVRDRLEASFSIYPNPATDRAFVVSDDMPAGDLHIRLHNLLGQTLGEMQAFHPGGRLVQQISIEGLGAGVYFVQLEMDGKHATQKLVIR